MTCNYTNISNTLHAFKVTIHIKLASTRNTISSIVFFTRAMSCCCFMLTLTFIIVSFLSRVTFFIIQITSTLSWNMFCKCHWLIYPFHHTKWFEVHAFKWIFYSITAPIKPVHTNYEWTVMKFINIHINKCWPDWVWLIIHG